jgi:ribonuclease P protein component
LIVSARPAGEVGPPQRIGITVSRRVGNAVVRNRVKRRVREWFRGCRQKLRGGIDVVVIGRARAAELSGREVSGTLCQLAQKARATRG